MSKIRLNTELRNKMFNKIKNVLKLKTLKNERHTYKQERMLIENINQHLNLQKRLSREHILKMMLKYYDTLNKSMVALVM
jgi:hypothetical protein